MNSKPQAFDVVAIVLDADDGAASQTPESSAVATTTATKKILIPDTLEVLTAKSEFWATALSIEHDRLLDWQRRMGYPVVVVTALTGLAAFTQLDGNPAWWATLTVGVVAFVAAGLAAAQTHGNFAARASTAADCSAKFATLFRNMLRAGDHLQGGGERTDAELDALYEEYEKLKSARPAVPKQVRDQAYDAIAHEAASIRARGDTRAR